MGTPAAVKAVPAAIWAAPLILCVEFPSSSIGSTSGTTYSGSTEAPLVKNCHCSLQLLYHCHSLRFLFLSAHKHRKTNKMPVASKRQQHARHRPSVATARHKLGAAVPHRGARAAAPIRKKSKQHSPCAPLTLSSKMNLRTQPGTMRAMLSCIELSLRHKQTQPSRKQR